MEIDADIGNPENSRGDRRVDCPQAIDIGQVTPTLDQGNGHGQQAGDRGRRETSDSFFAQQGRQGRAEVAGG